MGSGSKKEHEHFSVAPTVDEPGGPSDLSGSPPVPPATQAAAATIKDAYLAKLSQLEQTDLAGTDPGLGYALFKQSADDTWKACAKASQWNAAESTQLHQAFVAGCGVPLQKAPVTWLQTAALSQGFEHPTLADLGEEGALVTWLNPAVDAVAKGWIPAKATQRWHEIATGSTAYGVTLAEVTAAEHKLAEPVAAQSSPGPPAAPVSPPSPDGGDHGHRTFLGKQKAVEAALAHHVASTAPIPARRADEEVAGLQLTTIAAPALGGMHTKSFHASADGAQWMFKPDRAKGAVAQAEVAASRICALGGTPSVPVHVRDVDGARGSFQPLLAQTKSLTGDMAALSQHDVDLLVRSHVSAWLVGDHDCKPDNVLRTAGGGLVPVDHGQAFKFWGADSLSLTYNPNQPHNHDRTLPQKLYHAQQKGTLAPGVRVRPEAALGVIKRYEAVPDAEFREILAPVAREGVHRKVHWYTAMAARAAKTTGKAKPAPADIEAAFLDHAVERKTQLRTSFTEFFAGVFKSKKTTAAEAAA